MGVNTNIHWHWPSPAEIKRERERAGLTQAAAGRAIGYSARNFESWESGRSRMHCTAWRCFLEVTRPASRKRNQVIAGLGAGNTLG